MARLADAAREPSPARSAASSSGGSCIVLASTADTTSDATASTRPTSVSSLASHDAEESTKKRPSTAKAATTTKRRVSAPGKARMEDGPGPLMPPKAATLLGFGFTKGQHPQSREASPQLHMPKRSPPRRTTRQASSFLEPPSEDRSQRVPSYSSQAPLLVEDHKPEPIRVSPRKRNAEVLADVPDSGSASAKDKETEGLKVPAIEPRRDLSGDTLVEQPDEEHVKELEDTKAGKEEEEESVAKEDGENTDMEDTARKAAEFDRTTEQVDGHEKQKSSLMGKLKGKFASVASNLGKRKRDVEEAIERGKEKLQIHGGRKSARISTLDVTAEPDVVEKNEEPPSKKVRVSITRSPCKVTMSKASFVQNQPMRRDKRAKNWLNDGIYVGQNRHTDLRLNAAQNKKKLQAMSADELAENKSLPLPMWNGHELIKLGRDFKLPFDVYNPLPPGQPKPGDWKKTGSNKVIDDAAHIVKEWSKFNKLPASHCYCKANTGCDDNCLNRSMFYECDSKNCRLSPEQCGNRAFADLKERTEGSTAVREHSKEGKKYNVGVETFETKGKGFGVRASRTFNPGQIIVEYAGEMITTDECERRMVEVYKDAKSYYLMTFDTKLIIDATRGTIARFVNHSCAPNSHMIKWTVAGKPRMALFAGESGILTGEELTYDYNFDNFNADNTTLCACGAEECRGILGKKPTEQEIKRAKTEKERERLIREKERIEMAVEEQRRRKKRKSYRGWAYVDEAGNEVEPPESGSEGEVEVETEVQQPAKKRKITATISETIMGKDGEVVERERSVLRKKKLVGR